MHESLLNLLFSVISYIPSAVMEENAMGTVPFALRFFKLQVFINLLFAVVGTILGTLIMNDIMYERSMGLWPILMCDLVIQCY